MTPSLTLPTIGISGSRDSFKNNMCKFLNGKISSGGHFPCVAKIWTCNIYLLYSINKPQKCLCM